MPLPHARLPRAKSEAVKPLEVVLPARVSLPGLPGGDGGARRIAVLIVLARRIGPLVFATRLLRLP